MEILQVNIPWTVFDKMYYIMRGDDCYNRMYLWPDLQWRVQAWYGTGKLDEILEGNHAYYKTRKLAESTLHMSRTSLHVQIIDRNGHVCMSYKAGNRRESVINRGILESSLREYGFENYRVNPTHTAYVQLYQGELPLLADHVLLRKTTS